MRRSQVFFNTRRGTLKSEEVLYFPLRNVTLK